jgi:hypothetical protein
LSSCFSNAPRHTSAKGSTKRVVRKLRPQLVGNSALKPTVAQDIKKLRISATEPSSTRPGRIALKESRGWKLEVSDSSVMGCISLIISTSIYQYS